MKPPFDIAADLDTPVSAYLKLAPFRPRFLLESVEGGARLARYSFIGFGDCLDLGRERVGQSDREGFHGGNVLRKWRMRKTAVLQPSFDPHAGMNEARILLGSYVGGRPLLFFAFFGALCVSLRGLFGSLRCLFYTLKRSKRYPYFLSWISR